MRGVVVALGNFDGVHVGHGVVVRRAVEEARARGTLCVAATFDPHPRAVLGSGGKPGGEPNEDELKLLTTLDLRREALLGLGADEVRVVAFDEAMSRKSPEGFVREVLVGGLGARVVVVGENFRFGHRASGDVGDLGRLMRQLGGEAIAVSLGTADGGEEVSSTRIRRLVSTGDVRAAAGLLGRPYLLRGEVVVGDRRGRSIGFPTANVVPDPAVVVPARGVYAGFVDVRGTERGTGEARYATRYYVACTNVGVAPTFERRENKIEAHLIGFEGDLYGREVDVGFVERVRPERRFSGVGELKEQIARDVEAARRAMASWEGAV